eukprot:gene10587-14186_t
MAGWDLRALEAALPGLKVPLHLFVGSRDLTVPPAQAKRVALRVPGARVQVLEGLGHLAHEEAPAEVLRRIQSLTAAAGAAEGAHGRVPRRDHGPFTLLSPEQGMAKDTAATHTAANGSAPPRKARARSTQRAVSAGDTAPSLRPSAIAAHTVGRATTGART